MSPTKILIDLGLLCWPTLLHGLKKGWVNRNDVIDFALNLLATDNSDEDIAVIASGQSMSDDELSSLIAKQIKTTDVSPDDDKWRLAHLLCIAESDDSDQKKIDNLQVIYANFDYPEDMTSCSIYSGDGIDPLVAMIQVIEELKCRLLPQSFNEEKP